MGLSSLLFYPFKGGEAMEDFRCQCKKIICQIDGNIIIIKCRHCKRFIHIQTKGIIDIEYKLTSGIDDNDLSVIKLS